MEAWYALYTKPKQEALVARQLGQQGLLAFFPQYTERRRAGSRVQSLFPCYLFVRADLAQVGLSALQWTPGAGQPGMGAREWLEIYRRARRAGKSLLLLGVDRKDVRPLIEALGPEGVLIGTAASSQEEGEELLRAAQQWAA